MVEFRKLERMSNAFSRPAEADFEKLHNFTQHYVARLGRTPYAGLVSAVQLSQDSTEPEGAHPVLLKAMNSALGQNPR